MPLSGSDRTSRSLLAQVRGNDAEAWDRLVQLYAPLVFHWCRHRNLHEEDIADVMQEVFQAVASNIDRFQKKKPGDTFRGWLRTIARNKICDHFRHRTPKGIGGTEAHMHIAQLAEPPPLEENPAADRPIEASLLSRALESARPHFQEQTWRAFWRTVVDGQSAVDVAAELSLSPGAVRVAKSRVLHRLRSELGELPD